jgi:hypothetical protein
MSTTAMLKIETEQSLSWDSIFYYSFNKRKYKKYISKQMVGLYLCFFVHESKENLVNY